MYNVINKPGQQAPNIRGFGDTMTSTKQYFHNILNPPNKIIVTD